MHADAAIFWLAALLSACCTNRSVAGAEHRCPDGATSIGRVCFDTTAVAYKVVAREGEAATLRCVVRNLGREVVSWMRNDGRDIPLTVDTLLFAADRSRMRLNVSQSEGEWHLVIDPVRLSDAGQYLCQVDLRNGIIAQDYALIVEESDHKTTESPASSGSRNSNNQPSDGKRLLNDDQVSRGGRKQNSVSISGDSAVFSGTRHFPLTCTVRFASRDAKAMMATANDGGSRQSQLGIEWYHEGARQATEPGAMDISLSWADSDTAISVLTIGRVRPGHSGEWVCLKRPAEFGAALETATHTLRVLIRDAPDTALPDSSRAADDAQAAPASGLSSASLGARISASNMAQIIQLASSALLMSSMSLVVCALT